MKVLHISTSNGGSGAGIAAFRIHKSIQGEGIDSQMIVRHNFYPDLTNEIHETSALFGDLGKKFLPHIDKLPNRRYPKKDPALFSPAWWNNGNIIKKINELSPDLVHLHWINFGFLKIEQLNEIIAPIIWTMHDNWLFTGGCHIMWDCRHYLNSCGSCPRLGSNNPKDLSFSVWERKKKSFDRLDKFQIVTPSRWLHECASASSLLSGRIISVVPNPIHIDQFKPKDQHYARGEFGLAHDKKVILFGALDAVGDLNKGYDLLIEALQKVDLSNAQIVVFGSEKPMELPSLDCSIVFLGQLNMEDELATLYSAADLMIVPSRQESFGQTAAEAMACETPVVAFSHTGLLDIVDHLENGYLAEPANTDDLARGIEHVMNFGREYGKLARQKVKSKFEPSLVANKYADLYNQLVD